MSSKKSSCGFAIESISFLSSLRNPVLAGLFGLSVLSAQCTSVESKGPPPSEVDVFIAQRWIAEKRDDEALVVFIDRPFDNGQSGRIGRSLAAVRYGIDNFDPFIINLPKPPNDDERPPSHALDVQPRIIE